jgi:hypothetical protein
VTDEAYSGGPLNVPTLDVLARRGGTHPLVDGWAFETDAMSPRRLALHLDEDQYPPPVAAVRLDVRWFEGGDYAVQYLETRGDDVWQCRWDRHPKPDAPTAHFHPPPDAAADVEPSPLQSTPHLGVMFGVLDWITERIEQLYEE